jgi:hypothetical protein
MGIPPVRQQTDASPVGADQRFFFRARPSLDLPFRRDRIGY